MTVKDQILIQKYIEGNLSPQEIIIAEDIIKNNDDAGKYYEDLNSIESVLKEGAEIKVNINLKEQIMNEIHRNNEQKVHSVKTDKLFDRMFPSVRWSIAYAFILGIIIGALVVALVPKKDNLKDIDESQLSGSMLNSITGNAFNLPVEIPGIHMNIIADRLKENYLKIIVDLQNEIPGMVNLSFNKSGFYLQSIQILEENDECRITSSRNSVQMFNTGENKFIILMKKLSYLPEDINIQVFVDEIMKYENIVTIN